MSPQIKLYFFGDLVDKFMYHLSFQKNFFQSKRKIRIMIFQNLFSKMEKAKPLLV